MDVLGGGREDEYGYLIMRYLTMFCVGGCPAECDVGSSWLVKLII